MSDTGSDDSDADDEEEFIQNQKQANEWLIHFLYVLISL